jgi:sRNA-binding carbon storage regulator CsrA
MSQQKTDGKNNSGVCMDVRVGQSLMIGNVKVTVEKKDGQRARLRVVADKGIVICRPPMEIAGNTA